jgi:hypothetical protein
VFRKLFVATLGLLVLALAVFGLLAASATRLRVIDEIQGRLEANAEMLKVMVRGEQEPASRSSPGASKRASR